MTSVQLRWTNIVTIGHCLLVSRSETLVMRAAGA